jgi:hypothetical protein
MKNMLKVLYGNLIFNKKSDYIIVPLKILYYIFFPFFIVCICLILEKFWCIWES